MNEHMHSMSNDEVAYERQLAYERGMRHGHQVERERVSSVEFGTFNGDEMVASGTYEVGTMVEDPRTGDVYLVTEVGASWTAGVADPTFMQRHVVSKLTRRERMLVACGFDRGWSMFEFYDSHLSEER